jgi:hypothetical protein
LDKYDLNSGLSGSPQKILELGDDLIYAFRMVQFAAGFTKLVLHVDNNKGGGLKV